jgi:hypothetical protein
MTLSPGYPEIDDRARDEDLDRLRDAAAHFIDVVRRFVRAELDAGIHPVDAIAQGLCMLQSWEVGVSVDPGPSPAAYTRLVETTLTRQQERVGAESIWEWRRQPHDTLHGHTPLRALARHNERNVSRFIDTMPPAPTPAGE